MPTVFISPRQARVLRALVRRYRDNKIVLGKPWYRRSEDELWRTVLRQIVMVGNARPGPVLDGSFQANRLVALRHLKRFKSHDELRRHLHRVLCGIGARYVTQDWRTDKKTTAAACNFRALMKAGGPKAFFGKVSRFRSENKRIQFLRQNLRYYGEKVARDTLIDLRLASSCLALDTRIRGLLGKLGFQGVRSIGRDYAAIERELIDKVARPSRLSGATLDRILYQNYDYILADIRLSKQPT